MEGIELVQCSTAQMKTALFLLNLRFDYQPNSPLQYPGINFPREAEECEECDPPIAEISFNCSDPTNYNQYTQQLHELLQSE